MRGSFIKPLRQAVLPTSLYERLAASSIANRLARGSLWSLFGSASSRILVLVAMILVARILGQVEFGEFGVIQATLGVAGIMAGMGLGGTATRFVAQYAASEQARAGRVIALVMSVSIGTVGLATGALIAASDFISRTVLEAPHLRNALIWGSLLMAATAFRDIQAGVFAGLEKFDIIAKLNVLDGVVSLATMVLLARLMGVEGAVLGLALGAVAVWITGRILLMDELKIRGISVRYKGYWADWHILTDYGLPSLLADLVATSVLWLAMILVARSEHGFAGLGLYHAAFQFHGPMIFIPMVLMSVSMPVLVQEWEAGRRERFRKVTFWICGLMLAFAIPPVVLLSLLSPWIMNLYGASFRDGWIVLVLLLAAAPLHALAKIASGALFGMNRAWWVLGANLVWGVTLLMVTLWLVPRHGVTGLAIAFLAAYSVLGTLSFMSMFVGSRLLTIPDFTPHAGNQQKIP